MAKKKYYDQHGNQIRSRPTESFYQKWWFWLMITTIVIAGFIIFGNQKDNIEKPEAVETSKVDEKDVKALEDREKDNSEIDAEENAKQEAEYTLEDFEGEYILFSGEPYNSTIDFIVEIKDRQIIESELESEMYIKDIIDYEITSNTLTVDWKEIDLFSDEYIETQGTTKFELSFDGNQKKIDYGDHDESPLYSISEEDLYERYDKFEIDYARIIMMTGVPRIDPVKPVVIVQKRSAGDRIFNVDNSPTFPEDVTVLRSHNHSFSNHDRYSIAYSTKGDGNITLYYYPTNFELDIEAQLDDDFRKLAQEVVDSATSVYVEPSETLYIADFIGRVEFIYD